MEILPKLTKKKEGSELDKKRRNLGKKRSNLDEPNMDLSIHLALKLNYLSKILQSTRDTFTNECRTNI